MDHSIRMTYNTRKECIKRKAKELSILCDVKACAVIFGPDGKLETWPEKPTEVLGIIKTYRDSCNKKQSVKTKLKMTVEDAKNENLSRVLGGWKEGWLENSSKETLFEVLNQTEYKIKSVIERIECLKGKQASFLDPQVTSQTTPLWNAGLQDDDNCDFQPCYGFNMMNNGTSMYQISNNLGWVYTPCQPLQAVPVASLDGFCYSNNNQLAFMSEPPFPLTCHGDCAISSTNSQVAWPSPILEETKFDLMCNNRSQLLRHSPNTQPYMFAQPLAPQFDSNNGFN